MLTLVVVEFHDIAAAAVNGNRLDVVKRRGYAPIQSQIINPMAPDLNPDWTDCSNSGRQEVMSPEILWATPSNYGYVIHYINTCCMTLYWGTHKKELCRVQQ